MITGRTLLLLALLITSSVSVAQQKDEQGVYLVAEKMPEIKGGVQSVAEKLKYPRHEEDVALFGIERSCVNLSCHSIAQCALQVRSGG